MTNYLIKIGATVEHYTFRAYGGICVRKQSPSGVWQDFVPIIENGRDGFAVYSDFEKSVHIICADNENRLIYAFSENDEWKKYIISKLNDDIYVLDMKLYSIKGRLNLIYSALYNGETLLVHCILGDQAKPSTIDVIENSHFHIAEEKVYYTNKNGDFGYVLLSDEKPTGFNLIYEDAHFGTAYNICGSEKILFIRDNKLFLNGIELLSDKFMEMPVMFFENNKYYIMWKSGSFIKYITSKNGTTFSEPMRFISSGSIMSVYTVQNKNGFYSYYGTQNVKNIVLPGKPKIFEQSPDYQSSRQKELEKIQDMLNETKEDIIDTKKELARLGKLLTSLSDRD